MTLIADHHLIPVLADWSRPVRFALTWDTQVDASLRGYEARGAMRQWPRPVLTFPADVNGAAKYNDLRARLAAALRVDHFEPENTTGRTGRVCVPWAGRESWLAAAPGIPTLTLALEAQHHPWSAGDWLIIFSEDESSWATAEVQAVAGNANDGQTLTLTELLDFPLWPDTAICPLFFGSLKTSPIELQHDSPALGVVDFSVEGDSYQPDAWPGEGEEPPELPIAAFDFAIDCMEITFDGSPSQAGFGTILLGYEWSFGDGQKGEGETPAHTYLQPGTYRVTLTVRDNLGRRAQAEQHVTPIDCEAVAVGPDVPAPGDPVPGDPEGDPPDAPPAPPDPPADPSPLSPPAAPMPPEDYPNPPWPDQPTSAGDPIAPPGFGL